MTSYRIAAIPGDGIGLEVMPIGKRLVDAVGRRHGFRVDWTDIPWASCDWYQKTGSMMPADWQEQIGPLDAIFFGAVGWPATVPDHVSLWGSLLQFRRVFDQYVNLRPVRLMPGVRAPLLRIRGEGAGQPYAPGAIDMLIVRENTEGEYSSIGGRMFAGSEREIAIQETVMSRHGVDRVLRYAFEQAAKRPRARLTSATKSNGISITMPYWDERVAEMAKGFPGVAVDQFHIDILCANFVLKPDHFDVVVASNLFGDILSDLGPACTGTIGIAPSANLNPERKFPSLFEPVHGSAPDIAGKGVANPIGMVWSGVLMLEHLGQPAAAAELLGAIEAVLADPAAPHTADLGGRAGTQDLGAAIEQALGRA
jgi:tartrate dehydrogenase/decarboxylase/D-malate dehydrogenase